MQVIGYRPGGIVAGQYGAKDKLLQNVDGHCNVFID